MQDQEKQYFGASGLTQHNKYFALLFALHVNEFVALNFKKAHEGLDWGHSYPRRAVEMSALKFQTPSPRLFQGNKLTYLLTYLFHAAESFLRS